MIGMVSNLMTSYSQHDSRTQSKAAFEMTMVGLLANESFGKGPHDSPVLVYAVHSSK